MQVAPPASVVVLRLALLRLSAPASWSPSFHSAIQMFPVRSRMLNSILSRPEGDQVQEVGQSEPGIMSM